MFRSIIFCALIFCVSSVFAQTDNDGRIYPKDLKYVGAFRLPSGQEEHDWAWSGQALTYRPARASTSADKTDLPGSLFGSGHDWHQWVSEISIPKPVISKDKKLSDLSTAKTLQKFANITGDLYKGRYLEQPRMGLAYYYNDQTKGKELLYFCRAAHLDETGKEPSFGYCTVDLSAPQPKGLWGVSGIRNYLTTDYLLVMPTEWAHKNTPGKLLACGRFRDGGQASQGPTLYAFAAVDLSNPNPKKQRPATPLLKYSAITDEDNTKTLKGYNHSDDWGGAAWLSCGDKAALIFAGTKGVGKTWYGFANGVVWPEEGPYPKVPDYPNDQRGWWSEKFQPQLMFYDTADLAKVAAGKMNSSQPQPYAIMDLSEYLFIPPEKRQRQLRHIGACTCDRINGYLYVMEILVDDDKPIIHVWKIDKTKTDRDKTMPIK